MQRLEEQLLRMTQQMQARIQAPVQSASLTAQAQTSQGQHAGHASRMDHASSRGGVVSDLSQRVMALEGLLEQSLADGQEAHTQAAQVRSMLASINLSIDAWPCLLHCYAPYALER